MLGDLGRRRVVIIGAGDTAELTARALAEQGVSTLFVANRRRERALALAQRFGGETISFDELPRELERADIVVGSTASPHAIVGAEELAGVARGGRPLLLLDLAVPRDIDPECGLLPGVTLLDIDGLQAQVDRTHRARRMEARRAETIVEQEIHAFAGWLGTLEVMPTSPRCAPRPTRSWPSCWPRTKGAGRRWASATASAWRRCCAPPSSACCTGRPSGSGRSTRERRHAHLQLLRELFGLDEPDGVERPAAEVRELRRP